MTLSIALIVFYTLEHFKINYIKLKLFNTITLLIINIKMVQIRNKNYPVNTKYESYFENYPYELSDFQKHAIEGVIEKKHVLITAHTGSGKTLPAEFAIQDKVKQGKKVIYTSPIKALSNQKFYEFRNKYPHITFGLFTGDIKTNPEADVLIMTTEILMNRLFNYSNEKNTSDSMLEFQIDFENELEAVIFDEVHYINDAERGQVWEKTILMLPHHVQMIMLSATMDKPESFAKWIEDNHSKEVYLCPTNHRVVPLIHYTYMSLGEHEFKLIKDKATQQIMRKLSNKPILIKDSREKFNTDGYNDMMKIQKQVDSLKSKINRKFVLNNLTKYLKNNNMLPAIFFVFSRKNVESYAKDITVPILEEDSKIPYIAAKEANQIIRRLPNFEEYFRLPEYISLISLLEKGIGIHHSGMIPILREIVELFISKKYIKLLFATESFAIGLDCPIKTTVFTGIKKFDGNFERYLHPHEYTQMAGRAGRRGIDTIGHVIHCNNLFNYQPTSAEYKNIINGAPQGLVSKFKLDYSLILNVIKSTDSTSIKTIKEFVEKSMMNNEIIFEVKNNRKRISELESKIKKKTERKSTTPSKIFDEYKELIQSMNCAKQNKIKIKISKKIDALLVEYKYLIEDFNVEKEINDIQNQISTIQNTIDILDKYIYNQVNRVVVFLEKEGLLQHSNDVLVFTDKGEIASHIAEVHSPIWVTCMVDKWNYFEHFNSKQLVGLFSCVSNIKVKEEYHTTRLDICDSFLKEKILELREIHSYYDEEEGKNDIRTGIKYNELFSFHIVQDVMDWCDCKSEEDCKLFINTNLKEKEISLGDFTKSILKIATISKEFKKLYEIPQCSSRTEFLHKLTQIEELVLKYIATNQSLYV